jgi:hypothetical protein
MPTDDDREPKDHHGQVPPAPEEREREREREREERGMFRRLESMVPDLVKRGLYAGLGAVLTTEEGIRKAAADFSLPKDVANYLMSSAQTTKDEALRIMAREMREFLEKMNISQEIAKILTMLSFEIKTEIRFIPNDESLMGVKPDIRNKVAVKRQDKDEDDKKSSKETP